MVQWRHIWPHGQSASQCTVPTFNEPDGITETEPDVDKNINANADATADGTSALTPPALTPPAPPSVASPSPAQAAALTAAYMAQATNATSAEAPSTAATPATSTPETSVSERLSEAHVNVGHITFNMAVAVTFVGAILSIIALFIPVLSAALLGSSAASVSLFRDEDGWIFLIAVIDALLLAAGRHNIPAMIAAAFAFIFSLVEAYGGGNALADAGVSDYLPGMFSEHYGPGMYLMIIGSVIMLSGTIITYIGDRFLNQQRVVATTTDDEAAESLDEAFAAIATPTWFFGIQNASDNRVRPVSHISTVESNSVQHNAQQTNENEQNAPKNKSAVVNQRECHERDDRREACEHTLGPVTHLEEVELNEAVCTI